MANFVPWGANFLSRFVCECVQYVQFILYPETFDFAFDILFPLGQGGETSDNKTFVYN